MELTKCLHARFEYLYSHTTVDFVETLDDARFNGPMQCELFLKRFEFRLILDEVSIRNPLPVDSVEIRTTEIAPVLG